MKSFNLKKAVIIGMCSTIITTNTVFAVPANFQEGKIKIQINDEWIEMKINPFIENNRTLIPMDELILNLEELGAEAEWINDSETVKLKKDDLTLELKINDNNAKIINGTNEEMVALDVSPKFIDGQPFVPIRFIAEQFGAAVKWDDTERAVIIDTKDDIIAVERPIEFKVAERNEISDNEKLFKWFQNNYKTKGIYSIKDGNWTYVLVSAGEKTTGGYDIIIDSITEVTPGTAYVHGTLKQPEEGSLVTQVITYPCVLVKFEGTIDNVQYDITEINSDTEKNKIENLVEDFGKNLQKVSLLAPEEILKENIKEYYGDYITQNLMEKWMNDPETVPGRLTSSPWPDRIEIKNIEKTAENEYEITGEIIEITSVELLNGGAAAKKPINLSVKNVDVIWLIDNVVLGNYEETEAVSYENTEYGFKFNLPETWKDYSIVAEKWEGNYLNDDEKDSISGPVIIIRHPQWTYENQRQDIPVMIFTVEQWNSMLDGDFSVGAAPITPSVLGENSEYVFALPARYNYGFLTGYEEVEKIINENPIVTFDVN